jgi:membrane-bound lytic murein transglycosylase D
VPKLQAVVNLVARPEAFGIELPSLDNHPYFMAVAIESDIDVALAAQLAGITLEEFHQLNPQHNKPVILAAGSPQVLLPYDNANRFVRRLGRHQGPTATWTAWVAPKNVKPAEAARLVGISESQLRAANRIPARMVVKQGSTLLVPRSAHSETDVAEHIAHNAVLSLAPEARPYRRVVVKARRGDNVTSLARRHGVSVSQVAQWNGLGVRSALKVGQQVVLMLPVKPAKARATAPTARKKAAKPAPRRTRQAAPR